MATRRRDRQRPLTFFLTCDTRFTDSQGNGGPRIPSCLRLPPDLAAAHQSSRTVLVLEIDEMPAMLFVCASPDVQDERNSHIRTFCPPGEKASEMRLMME